MKGFLSKESKILIQTLQPHLVRWMEFIKLGVFHFNQIEQSLVGECERFFLRINLLVLNQILHVENRHVFYLWHSRDSSMNASL